MIDSQKRRPAEAIKKKKELEIQLADASAMSDPKLGCKAVDRSFVASSLTDLMHPGKYMSIPQTL